MPHVRELLLLLLLVLVAIMAILCGMVWIVGGSSIEITSIFLRGLIILAAVWAAFALLPRIVVAGLRTSLAILSSVTLILVTLLLGLPFLGHLPMQGERYTHVPAIAVIAGLGFVTLWLLRRPRKTK